MAVLRQGLSPTDYENMIINPAYERIKQAVLNVFSDSILDDQDEYFREVRKVAGWGRKVPKDFFFKFNADIFSFDVRGNTVSLKDDRNFIVEHKKYTKSGAKAQLFRLAKKGGKNLTEYQRRNQMYIISLLTIEERMDVFIRVKEQKRKARKRK